MLTYPKVRKFLRRLFRDGGDLSIAETRALRLKGPQALQRQLNLPV